MLGAGLFGMMFGGGFGGGAGMFGMVFQLLLIGGLAYGALRLIRGRMAANAGAPQSAYSGAVPRLMEPPLTRSSVPLTGLLAGASATATAPMAITTRRLQRLREEPAGRHPVRLQRRRSFEAAARR